MLDALVKFFSRKPKRSKSHGICGTPAIMSGELKLIDEVAKETPVSTAASEQKAPAETPSYLPPPAWLNTDSDSRKPKPRKK